MKIAIALATLLASLACHVSATSNTMVEVDGDHFVDAPQSFANDPYQIREHCGVSVDRQASKAVHNPGLQNLGSPSANTIHLEARPSLECLRSLQSLCQANPDVVLPMFVASRNLEPVLALRHTCKLALDVHLRGSQSVDPEEHRQMLHDLRVLSQEEIYAKYWNEETRVLSSDEQMLEMLHAAREELQLEALRISMPIGSSDLKLRMYQHIGELIRAQADLKEAVLSGLSLEKTEALDEVVSAVAHHPNIVALGMQFCFLTEEGGVLLAKALKEADKENLTVLNLANNHLGEQAAQALAPVLEENEGLERVYLHGNDWTAAGLKELTEALEDHDDALQEVTLMSGSVELSSQMEQLLRRFQKKHPHVDVDYQKSGFDQSESWA